MMSKLRNSGSDEQATFICVNMTVTQKHNTKHKRLMAEIYR